MNEAFENSCFSNLENNAEIDKTITVNHFKNEGKRKVTIYWIFKKCKNTKTADFKEPKVSKLFNSTPKIICKEDSIFKKKTVNSRKTLQFPPVTTKKKIS